MTKTSAIRPSQCLSPKMKIIFENTYLLIKKEIFFYAFGFFLLHSKIFYINNESIYCIFYFVAHEYELNPYHKQTSLLFRNRLEPKQWLNPFKTNVQTTR